MDAAFAWADEPGDAATPGQFDGPFVVWPENWDTVLLFWSLRRCWRLHPLGGVMGYDWTQVQSKMSLKGFDAERMTLEDARLELMQDAVVKVLG